MKFLTGNHELDLLAGALSYSSPSIRVTTRIEAYSCKPVSKERKTYKQFDQSLVSDISHSISLSPPEDKDGVVDSAFGPLDKKESRKTFWLLIATLNQAFPDHDFTTVRPEEFKKEPNAKVFMGPLSNILSLSASAHKSFSGYPSSYPPDEVIADPFLARNPFSYFSNPDHAGHPFLRQILDPVISIQDCEIYSYNPDVDSDPHAFDSDDEDDEEVYGDLGDEIEDEFQFGPMDWEASDPALSRPTTPRPRRSRSIQRPETPVMDPKTWFFDDDSSSGLLWSANWFLYNRRMKRIVFLSIWGTKNSPGMHNPRHRPILIGRRNVGSSMRNELAVKKAWEMFYAEGGGDSSPDDSETSPPKTSAKLPDVDLPSVRAIKRNGEIGDCSDRCDVEDDSVTQLQQVLAGRPHSSPVWGLSSPPQQLKASSDSEVIPSRSSVSRRNFEAFPPLPLKGSRMQPIFVESSSEDVAIGLLAKEKTERPPLNGPSLASNPFLPKDVTIHRSAVPDISTSAMVQTQAWIHRQYPHASAIGKLRNGPQSDLSSLGPTQATPRASKAVMKLQDYSPNPLEHTTMTRLLYDTDDVKPFSSWLSASPEEPQPSGLLDGGNDCGYFETEGEKTKPTTRVGTPRPSNRIAVGHSRAPGDYYPITVHSSKNAPLPASRHMKGSHPVSHRTRNLEKATVIDGSPLFKGHGKSADGYWNRQQAANEVRKTRREFGFSSTGGTNAKRHKCNHETHFQPQPNITNFALSRKNQKS
ncbi:Maf1-domain-containing protein [Atractiella rhizophila]|nr:Maf1-domain-containing protein [Atractiella rhizophila]